MWTPYPNSPQEMALHSKADVLGFGGQAGGGKSFGLLGIALTQHSKARIYRTEYTQLKDLADAGAEIVGRDQFNGSDLTWRDLPGGRQLQLAACSSFEDAQKKWKGRAADFIGFDEATEFAEKTVRFLMGWNRTTKKSQRCRVMLTFNPPTTPEGEWIIRFFAPWLDKKHPNPAVPGELRWFAMVDGQEIERPDAQPFEHVTRDGKIEMIAPRSRTFIPAKLSDNPILAATGYGAQLQALPEPLRSQLLYGDFAAGVEDDPWQVIPTHWVEAAIERGKKTPRPMGTDGSLTPLSCLGVDPSRGGQAATVIAKRYDNWFAPLISHHGETTSSGPKVAKLVLDEWEEGAAINVDVVGVGTSVVDALESLSGGFDAKGNERPELPINGVNGAQPTKQRDKSGKFRLTNTRTAMYWKMREALDPDNGDGICLPDDAELKADLCAPRFKVTAEGIAVEPKYGSGGQKGIAERLGRSPDKGDAVVLAHWLGGVWYVA